MAACPSREQLARLLAEQLAGAELAAVQEHVERCTVCQGLLEHLTAAKPANRPTNDAPVSPTAAFFQRLMHQPPPPGFRSSRATRAPHSVETGTLPSFPGYQLLAELGRGVSGVVYQARENATHRLVAVKWLRTRSTGPASARFRREVEALAVLRHPGLVRIFGVGEHLGRPFYVMELVEGPSLDRLLAQGPLPVEQAVRLVASLSRAMHAAHTVGWVHRDLKPANVLLVSGGVVGGEWYKNSTHHSPLTTHHSPLTTHQPKVADFGLAKHREDVLRYTESGAVVGTPCYMAPEQAYADGREVGPPADVYALGAILYECLTGRPPFQGPTIPAILEQVRTQLPMPPRQLRPDIPEELQAICLRCLAKDPAARYPRADALADDLEHFLQIFLPPSRDRKEAEGRDVQRIRKGFRQRAAFLLLFILGAGTVAFTAYRTTARDENAIADPTFPASHSAAVLEAASQRKSVPPISPAPMPKREVPATEARPARPAPQPPGVPPISPAPMPKTEVPATEARPARPAGVLKPPGKGDAGEGIVKRAPAPPDDIRGKPAPQPARVFVPLQRWRPPQSDGATAMALAPGGKSLVYASNDRKLTRWDIAGRQKRFQSAAFPEPITALGFAPDGQSLAVGLKDGSALVVDSRTGKIRSRHASLNLGEVPPVVAVALGSAGRVAAGLPSGLRLWSGGSSSFTSDSSTRIHDVVVAPNGRTFACALQQGDESGIRLLDAEGGPVPRSFLPAAGARRVLFAPDGRTVAALCGERTVGLWDTATGKERASVVLAGTTVTALAFTPDGKAIALGTSGGQLHRWDPKTGKRESSSLDPKEAVSLLAFAGDGKSLVVVSANLTVVITRLGAPTR